MTNAPPPLPNGNTPFHTWCQWVQRAIVALRPVDTPGTKTNRTTRGTEKILSRKNVSVSSAGDTMPVWL